MNRPLVIAHRGACRDAPENTMAAFRLAWEAGADGIETDLRLTADGSIACFHDSTGRRVLGVRAPLRSLSEAEIRGAQDAGRWKGERGVRVPFLRELLEESPPDSHLVLELKEEGDLLDRLVPALRENGAAPVTLISFLPQTIADAKRRLPGCRALLLMDRHHPGGTRGGRTIARNAKNLGLDGVDLPFGGKLDERLLAPLFDAGLLVFTYTVNTSGGIRRCAELGVDAVTTDRPAFAIGWLRNISP